MFSRSRDMTAGYYFRQRRSSLKQASKTCEMQSHTSQNTIDLPLDKVRKQHGAAAAALADHYRLNCKGSGLLVAPDSRAAMKRRQTAISTYRPGFHQVVPATLNLTNTHLTKTQSYPHSVLPTPHSINIYILAVPSHCLEHSLSSALRIRILLSHWKQCRR